MPTRHRLEDSGFILLPQRAFVDSLQPCDVTHETFAAMNVQVVGHKVPARVGIGSHRVVDMPTKVAKVSGTVMVDWVSCDCFPMRLLGPGIDATRSREAKETAQIPITVPDSAFLSLDGPMITRYRVIL